MSDRDKAVIAKRRFEAHVRRPQELICQEKTAGVELPVIFVKHIYPPLKLDNNFFLKKTR